VFKKFQFLRHKDFYTFSLRIGKTGSQGTKMYIFFTCISMIKMVWSFFLW